MLLIIYFNLSLQVSAYLRDGIELVGRLDQGFSLLFQGIDYYWRAMPQTIYCPAAYKVEIFLALVIPGQSSLTANKGHGDPVPRSQKQLLL